MFKPTKEVARRENRYVIGETKIHFTETINGRRR